MKKGCLAMGFILSNGWMRYEDGVESLENMVESGGGDGGLKGCLDPHSINKGLRCSKDSGFELITYSDADLAWFLDDYKSTSGGLQFLGDKLVNWSSKKQDCTAMSTAEAEYVSLSAC
ncbi:hypothetical protein Tco_0686792 [Tanacetum coccineum]